MFNTNHYIDYVPEANKSLYKNYTGTFPPKRTILNLKELHINSDTNLEKLRKLLEEDFEIREIFPQDNKSLYKFLYCKDSIVNDAYQLIKNYCAYRTENSDLFKNLTIQSKEIRNCLENVLPGILPQKDKKCRPVIVFYANNWDTSYPLTTIYKTFLKCLNHSLEDVHNQNNGFVIIVDWDRFNFWKSTFINRSFLSLVVKGLAQSYPVKIKEVHFVGSLGWYLSSMLTLLCKAFLDQEMQENIYFHGRNLSNLHKYIHKDVLPTELGGEQSSYNPQKLILEMDNNEKSIFE